MRGACFRGMEAFEAEVPGGVVVELRDTIGAASLPCTGSFGLRT
jgi:hypothetical protein